MPTPIGYITVYRYPTDAEYAWRGGHVVVTYWPSKEIADMADGTFMLDEDCFTTKKAALAHCKKQYPKVPLTYATDCNRRVK